MSKENGIGQKRLKKQKVMKRLVVEATLVAKRPGGAKRLKEVVGLEKAEEPKMTRGTGELASVVGRSKEIREPEEIERPEEVEGLEKAGELKKVGKPKEIKGSEEAKPVARRSKEPEKLKKPAAAWLF